MKIHEYQAKQILIRYGVKIPEGKVAHNSPEAYEIARQLGGTVAVKAQIHAGGRGKGGGIKIAKSPDEAEEMTRELIGSKLVTPQTGAEGRVVQCVLIEEGLNIQREFYLGIVIDRSRQKPVFMASREGGVEIEEVARKSPDLILKETIQPGIGLQSFQARKIAFGLGLDAKVIGKAARLMSALYRAFEETDASLVEVNPLVITEEGELYALDAKMNFDSNALFRHPEIVALRDTDEEDQKEIQASKIGLSYIALEGNIGCMVNGAGLAMATMDIIKLCGGEPANFLDVGGGASKDKVAQAFKIVLSDQRVQGVLVNIFGGIMRCDVIAEGIVEAAREMKITVPLVVRLQGTNGELGKKLLSESNLRVISADTMAEAAEKIVKAVNQF
ncbi:MAG: ADP-forming succinate--CoA ligase subunit beta [Acidobacteria bacterium]|nr:ADP-forming succinate--CoA ligase subunit beta [Acidobacteriota bacterium]